MNPYGWKLSLYVTESCLPFVPRGFATPRVTGEGSGHHCPLPVPWESILHSHPSLPEPALLQQGVTDSCPVPQWGLEAAAGRNWLRELSKFSSTSQRRRGWNSNPVVPWFNFTVQGHNGPEILCLWEEVMVAERVKSWAEQNPGSLVQSWRFGTWNELGCAAGSCTGMWNWCVKNQPVLLCQCWKLWNRSSFLIQTQK